MRCSEFAEAMAMAVDRLVSAGAITLDRAIEATVDRIGRFSGKDATSYLETYKSERLTWFTRVVTPHIHTKTVEIQEGYRCRPKWKKRGGGSS